MRSDWSYTVGMVALSLSEVSGLRVLIDAGNAIGMSYDDELDLYAAAALSS